VNGTGALFCAKNLEIIIEKNALHRGFTLIELLVVATILGVLMTVAVVPILRLPKKSRNTNVPVILEQIRTALEMYRADYGFVSGSQRRS